MPTPVALEFRSVRHVFGGIVAVDEFSIDVAAGEVVAGIPAQPARETLRQVAALRKLPDYLARQGRSKG